MAGSLAYGSPISRSPAARVRVGISSRAVSGRKPLVSSSTTSSRVNSLLNIWPTTARPPPRMLMGRRSISSSLKQAFLGGRTRDAQGMTLTQAQLGIELLFDAAGQREIEILASQQQVLADGGALEFDVAALHVRTHQAEVGGAASDVANQNQLAVAQVLAERVLMLRHPRVKRSQRLFQQSEILQSGLTRGVHRQLAGFLVERGGHGQHDLLILEELQRIDFPVSRQRVVPRVSQMHEVAGRGFDGRHHRLRRLGLARQNARRCDRSRSGTATTSPKTPAVPAPALPGRGP